MSDINLSFKGLGKNLVTVHIVKGQTHYPIIHSGEKCGRTIKRLLCTFPQCILLRHIKRMRIMGGGRGRKPSRRPAWLTFTLITLSPKNRLSYLRTVGYY